MPITPDPLVLENSVMSYSSIIGTNDEFHVKMTEVSLRTTCIILQNLPKSCKNVLGATDFYKI